MKQKIQEYLQKIKQNMNHISEELRKKISDRKNDGLPVISVKTAVCIAVPLALFAALLWFFIHFSVKEVIVLGNIHYTKEEITQTVQRGLFGNNTLLVSHGQRSITPDGMELVDRIDVEMKDEHTLQITVQERQLIGYVQYLDCNLYFDSEGRVMNSVVREENTGEEEQQALAAEAVGKTATSYVAAMKEAPLIRGLSFAWARLHEILPVEEESVFNTILGISRMVNKYSIAPDAVEFDDELNITLIYGDVTVDLGPDKLMEEKLARVAAILPSIEGKTGILHLEDYDGGSENIVFSQPVLAAEGIDEEEESGEESQPQEEMEETVSHEYALAVPENGNLKTASGTAKPQNGEDLQQSGTQSTGGTAQQSGTQATDGTSQQSGTQTTKGTAQQSGTQATDGITQQSGTQTTGGTTQQGGTQTTGGTTQQSGTQTTGDTTQQSTSQTGSQQSGTSATQGMEEIRIDKPVLNNLP